MCDQKAHHDHWLDCRLACGRSVWLLLALLTASSTAVGQPAGPRTPAGRFITLTSPITDAAIGGVRRTALELLEVASREGREAVLVLEVTPGSSQFHHVYALADFLTSPEVARLRTIAWVPQTVTGDNVVAVLACREIVTAPGVQLGDIGRGTAVSPEQRAVVLELVARGGNRLVAAPLAAAMLDPQVELRQLTIDLGNGQTERRLATASEAADLARSGAVVPESRVLKDRGSVGVFTAEAAREGGYLVQQIVDSRRAVADLYRLEPESLRESPLPSAIERAHLIEVRGMIDPVMAAYLQRQIVRAVEGQTQLLIFELHASGGNLTEVRDLALAIARLQESDVRTIAWVPESAVGEAALIALACDEIYLTPTARLGAITRRRDFLKAGDQNAEQRFLVECLRELADIKQRPAAVLLAMADPKLQIFQATHRETGEVTFRTDEELVQGELTWLRGPLVSESGRGALVLTGERATQLLVAQPPVATFDDVRHRLGLPDAIRTQRIEKTWVDELVFTLNRRSVTGMLFALALILIYVELHFMTGFLGLAALTCFALFFWSRFLGGTAGGLEMLLFLLGMGALALELFVLPGFGIFGAAGAGLVLVSLVMASQTFGNIETGRDLSEATETLKMLGLSIASVIATAVLLSRFLPQVPFLRDMVLTPPGGVIDPTRPLLAPEEVSPAAGLVGATGTAETVLRPAGKARIKGQMLAVVSNGPYIPAGRTVEVVSVTGNHIVVREV